jgi:hypothetical protein
MNLDIEIRSKNNFLSSPAHDYPSRLPFGAFTRFTLPALLSCRSQRQRPLRRDWLRIADRLAVGLPAAAAALPEGGDEAMVAGLLQREDFQALVEAAREWQEDSEEAARRKLVVMARQALDWEDDPRAALFVLDEEARGRDPAATVADVVLKGPRRAPSAEPGVRSRPPRLHDPLSALCGRTKRRLADEVRGEVAVRHATATRLTTAEAARRALALKRGAAHPVDPSRHPPARATLPPAARSRQRPGQAAHAAPAAPSTLPTARPVPACSKPAVDLPAPAAAEVPGAAAGRQRLTAARRAISAQP